MTEAAFTHFKGVLNAAIARYRAMPQFDFVSAIMALAKDSGVEFEGSAEVGHMLRQLAKLGSIDAVAAMTVAGCSETEVAEALADVVSRSADVKEGAVHEGLVLLADEFLEEEVAAGRMTKSICPETGRTLYGSKDGSHE